MSGLRVLSCLSLFCCLHHPPSLEEQKASRVSYELVARPLATVVTVTVLCHPQLTLGLEVIDESEAQLGKALS